MKRYTTKQLRTGRAGYGIHVARITDHRRKHTIVCYRCRGPIYRAGGRAGEIHCEQCGEIRAVETINR